MRHCTNDRLNLFGTTAIDISAWIGIVAFGMLLFTAVEIEKYLIRKTRF